MTRPLLPLVVLAGRNPRPALPDGAGEVHPLQGAKGFDVRIGGRPLVDLVLACYQRLERFVPLYVAGPAAVYGERRGDALVIDTDGDFGANVRAAVESVMQRHPGSPMALTTCDVLPSRADLERLLADYDAHAPLDFWFPMVRAPEDRQLLGASAWKPQYRVISDGRPTAILPGHLLVVDPRVVRRRLVYRSFELAYESRNRGLLERFFLISRHVFGGLLAEDLHRLRQLRLPTFTVAALWSSLRLATRLRRGVISEEELAARLWRVFCRAEQSRRPPGHRGRMRALEALSLAKDIDTQEEARELERQLGGESSQGA